MPEMPADALDELMSEVVRLGARRGTIEMDMLPMRAISEPSGPLGDAYSFELKLDGGRCIARKNGDDVLLQNRRLRDVTRIYPEVARAIAELTASVIVLDGELVAFDDTGRPDFHRYAQRVHLFREIDIRHAVKRIPVFFIAFDILAIGPYDLRRLPLFQRRKVLRAVLQGKADIRVLDVFERDPDALLDFCCQHRLEGLVAKRHDSPYRPGPSRSEDWVKLKCEREDDFVLVGHTIGEGARCRMGAIDVASFQNGKLLYRGKVGSGLDDDAIDTLLARIEPLRTNAPVAQGDYHPAPRGRVHVRPEIVVSVRYAGFSDSGSLRFPVFRGIRDDVALDECTAAPHVARDLA